MATKRSPNYPQITLEEALRATEGIYRADMRNKMSQKTVSNHLGYSGVNGRSLAKIGALKAYDLLEGRGEELRLTERAVHLIADPKNSTAWKNNVQEAAFAPSIFKELNDHYEGNKASPENLRSELIKRAFTLDAVDKVAKIYLANYEFATQNELGNNTPDKSNDDEKPNQEENMQINQVSNQPAIAQGGLATPVKLETNTAPTSGTRRAVFTLDEGDVIITFPEELSPYSVEDLENYLKIFMKKAKRAAGIN